VLAGNNRMFESFHHRTQLFEHPGASHPSPFLQVECLHDASHTLASLAAKAWSGEPLRLMAEELAVRMKIGAAGRSICSNILRNCLVAPATIAYPQTRHHPFVNCSGESSNVCLRA